LALTKGMCSAARLVKINSATPTTESLALTENALTPAAQRRGHRLWQRCSTDPEVTWMMNGHALIFSNAWNRAVEISGSGLRICWCGCLKKVILPSIQFPWDRGTFEYEKRRPSADGPDFNVFLSAMFHATYPSASYSNKLAHLSGHVCLRVMRSSVGGTQMRIG